jgi:NAD(P)-dependent dehydrogenase (short-subunit alcohol dehydrogenase family)
MNGKVALVTGGASGIGEAIVREFVSAGVSTAFLDIDEKRGHILADKLSRQGLCTFCLGDVSEESNCAAFVQQAEQRYGHISFLVNNAALFLYRSVEATPAEWHRILDINVLGSSLAARYASESMKRHGGGAIVNISSISAFIAQPGTMTYNVTKAALLEMTRCMALDLGPFGIRVNAVCPGYTTTRGFYDYVASSGRQAGEVEHELASRTMLNRIGRPEEVAKCVRFLCSDDASYVTGTTLMVDGGLTAH